jgi:hypothetical protein
MKRFIPVVCLLLSTGCAQRSATFERQGAAFAYPVSDAQALAQCKAEAQRDAHNYSNGSFEDDFWHAFDTPAMIRVCMEGKGYASN